MTFEFKIVVSGKYPFTSLFHKVNSRDEAVCVELSTYQWNMRGMRTIRSCLCGRGDPLQSDLLFRTFALKIAIE